MDRRSSRRGGRRPPDVRRQRAALEWLPGPLAGGLIAGALGVPVGTVLETGLVCFLTLLLSQAVADRPSRHASLLPLIGALTRVAGPVLGLALLALLEIFTTLPGVGRTGLVLVGATAAAATVAGELLARRTGQLGSPLNVAVIGGCRAADSLARELAGAGEERYVVTGRIRASADVDDHVTGAQVATLGSLDDLGAVVEEHEIDLLLMTAEVPRLHVFDEIARSCLHLPVRLQELASFYEERFGHVPVAEINAAWFQCIMHPRYRSSSPVAQRILDAGVAAVALVLLAPLIAVVGLLIRRDGGPALFSQRRIGESGRPFTIWKLRTMSVGASNTWAGADDARITRLGRLLRRTHFDELPQLYNVLMGDMSLVGPRPEQPQFVERLEQTIPFYSRRHLVKPGLTGWAQVRCGYAGSDVGSAWKVSHDLYYLKHKSFGLNLMILAETLRTLVADRQYTAEPHTVAFILRHERTALDPDSAAEWPPPGSRPVAESV